MFRQQGATRQNKLNLCVYLLLIILASIISAISARLYPVNADNDWLSCSSQSDISKKIMALNKEYPDGKRWTNLDPSPSYVWTFPGSLVSMGGCSSFAAIIQDSVFGNIETTPVTWQPITKNCVISGIAQNPEPYSWEKLWPGDILKFNGHTVIVVQKETDYVVVAEGNYCGQIRWGRELSRKGVESAKYVLTRYNKNEPLMPYLDLPDRDHWSWTPVTWALIHKIMEPAAPMYVMADTACTRADMITFLWRAFGSPEPAGGDRPFIDITPDMPCYKAVYWAFDAGATVGTSSTLFSPGQSCTRAQALTMIWRAVGSPNVTNRYTGFEDVNDDNYYFKTVNWAIKNNITSGTTATTFSPKKICSKAEAVAFLYRSVQCGEIDN